jgi:membrane-associated phospholipid phosphatase
MNSIYDVDRTIASALQSLPFQQDHTLHSISAAFNWWGGPGVIWFAAILWLGGRALKHLPVSTLGLRGAEAIAVASAISGIVKGFAGRARPFVSPDDPGRWNYLHGWTDARYFSMPSGHTTATVAFAAAIGVASLRWAPSKRVAMIVGAFAAAFLVAFARLYSNQHWFSDVAAGAALGWVTGFLLTRWHERHPHSAFDRVLLGATADQQAA